MHDKLHLLMTAPLKKMQKNQLRVWLTEELGSTTHPPYQGKGRVSVAAEMKWISTRLNDVRFPQKGIYSGQSAISHSSSGKCTLNNNGYHPRATRMATSKN